MRRVILVVLLVVASSGAMAKWVKVAENETNAAYADSATIRNGGGVARMWTLFDYKTAEALDNGKQYMSTRAQFEYDCREERIRGLAVSFHSGNMAGGKIIHNSFEPGTWGPVPPGTTNAALWRIACRK